MKKKLSWHFYAVCSVIAIITVIMFAHFSSQEEYACEMADLQTMRSAQAAAVLLWHDSLPEGPVEYWFDTKTLLLVLASEPMPDPYGVGTKRVGHAIKAFDGDTGSSFDYLENEDYTDKILHVVVSNKDGNLDLRLEWVTSR